MAQTVKYNWWKTLLIDQPPKHLTDDTALIRSAVDLSNDQIIVVVFITEKPLVFLLFLSDLLKLLHHSHRQIDRAVAAFCFRGFQHQRCARHFRLNEGKLLNDGAPVNSL